MKIFSIFFIFLTSAITVCAQNPCGINTNKEPVNFTLTNKGNTISEGMIWAYPNYFERGKAPLFLVNGKRVACIGAYNRQELKSIVVLDPKEAIAKYGSKGKNGAIITTLKEEVKVPYLQILTNKTYYRSATGDKMTDTTCEYCYGAGMHCTVRDMRDTAAMQTLYINFENKIVIKHLGVGWDRTTISIINGTMSGSGEERLIKVRQKGFATLNINTCPLTGECRQTVIKFKVTDLPEWKRM